MKISKAIKQLQAIHKKFGDLEIVGGVLKASLFILETTRYIINYSTNLIISHFIA